ncbi:MAG TPA: hypothetical protein GX716_11190 [Firmicutes bacterium]|jgi:hypothetical protein|nr:hypothetical protein [Candidatus Fermentithermobacillaceae bacterium]
MKPHLSVLMLVARSTIYKVIGLFLILAVVDGLLFHFALGPNQVGTDRVFIGLEHAFTKSRVPVAFGVSFLAMTILLQRTGYAPGGKPGYTLRRLSVAMARTSTTTVARQWTMSLLR